MNQVSHEIISTASTSADVVRQEEGTSWQYDPNEPRYCLCNDVSYGDMVGCDNADVSKIDINTTIFSGFDHFVQYFVQYKCLHKM